MHCCPERLAGKQRKGADGVRWGFGGTEVWGGNEVMLRFCGGLSWKVLAETIALLGTGPVYC